MDFKEIILTHKEYFSTSSIWNDILRSIGWGIVKFLAMLSNLCEQLFNAAYEMINIIDTDAFKKIRFKIFCLDCSATDSFFCGNWNISYVFREKTAVIKKHFNRIGNNICNANDYNGT